MTDTMIAQNKYEYAMTVSHLTDVELLRHSDELHEALDKKESINEEQVKGLEEGIQAIFEAVLRREALTAMSMDELNQCIVSNEEDHMKSEEATEQSWNAQVWEADARAEFMRRMEHLVHAAFTEESSEDSEEDESEDIE